jgi:hypothetical protein
MDTDLRAVQTIPTNPRFDVGEVDDCNIEIQRHVLVGYEKTYHPMREAKVPDWVLEEAKKGNEAWLTMWRGFVIPACGYWPAWMEIKAFYNWRENG